MLKFEVDSLDGVEESQRGFYVKGDTGKYVLNVDGAVPKSKVDEFRTTNIELLKKLEGYKDVDVSKYKDLLELDRKAREKELIARGEVDQVVNDRVKTMREEYETKLNSTLEQNTVMSRQLETLLVDNAVKGAAVQSGVLATALDDVILRAKTTFKIENGVPVAKDNEGKVIYGEDGKTPMSVDTWVKMLKKTAPHLFAGFQGSGAGGGNNVGGKDMSKMSAIEKIALGLESRS